MQALHIHVLGPDGPGRSELESALTALGCSVSGGRAAPGAAPGADALVLDARGDQSALADALAGLVADRRPALLVAERPCPLVAELAGRPGGAVLATGSESPAGYRVCVSLLAALREGPRAEASDGSLTGAAL